VGRTLLSAAFDFGSGLSKIKVVLGLSKIKVQDVGHECPTQTKLNGQGSAGNP
jgi:hypothetical protein